jgi:predicted ATPase with chaperone activity
MTLPKLEGNYKLGSTLLENTDTYARGEVRQFCKLRPEGQSLIRVAMSRLNLSARAYHRILAELAGSKEIQSVDLAEARQYRPKVMMG